MHKGTAPEQTCFDVLNKYGLHVTQHKPHIDNHRASSIHYNTTQTDTYDGCIGTASFPQNRTSIVSTNRH